MQAWENEPAVKLGALRECVSGVCVPCGGRDEQCPSSHPLGTTSCRKWSSEEWSARNSSTMTPWHRASEENSANVSPCCLISLSGLQHSSISSEYQRQGCFHVSLGSTASALRHMASVEMAQ
jgi:hypothetical protein